MKTFTDYSDEVPIQFIKFTLDGKHGWVGKNLTDIILPPDTIVVLIIRGENQIVPDGKTVLEKEIPLFSVLNLLEILKVFIFQKKSFR